MLGKVKVLQSILETTRTALVQDMSASMSSAVSTSPFFSDGELLDASVRAAVVESWSTRLGSHSGGDCDNLQERRKGSFSAGHLSDVASDCVPSGSSVSTSAVLEAERSRKRE